MKDYIEPSKIIDLIKEDYKNHTIEELEKVIEQTVGALVMEQRNEKAFSNIVLCNLMLIMETLDSIMKEIN